MSETNFMYIFLILSMLTVTHLLFSMFFVTFLQEEFRSLIFEENAKHGMTYSPPAIDAFDKVKNPPKVETKPVTKNNQRPTVTTKLNALPGAKGASQKTGANAKVTNKGASSTPRTSTSTTGKTNATKMGVQKSAVTTKTKSSIQKGTTSTQKAPTKESCKAKASSPPTCESPGTINKPYQVFHHLKQ